MRLFYDGNWILLKAEQDKVNSKEIYGSGSILFSY